MVILDTSTGTAFQCAAAVLGSAVDSIILLNIILPSAAMDLSSDSAEHPADSDSSAEQPVITTAVRILASHHRQLKSVLYASRLALDP